MNLRYEYIYIFFFFQYILSSGKDSTVKLWELSTSRCLIAYTGAGTTGTFVDCYEFLFSSCFSDG